MLSERVIGKKAWVTGAAHGIGRASAWALAEAGADVAISDINEKGLEETAEYIRKLGRKALVLPADITKESEIEETINTKGYKSKSDRCIYLFTCSRKSNDKTKKRKHYPYCIYVRTYSKYPTMPMCI